MCMRGGSPETDHETSAIGPRAMRDFRLSMSRFRTGRSPMVRLRAIPLFTELKDLDLRPHPPNGGHASCGSAR